MQIIAAVLKHASSHKQIGEALSWHVHHSCMRTATVHKSNRIVMWNMQGSKRDVQRSSKRYVIPINKRMHCILICFTWRALVHMFSSEYVYVVVFIHKKDSKRRLCEVSARICNRFAQRHQLAKAFSKALACEVVAAQTSATHAHNRTLMYVSNMVASHRYRRHHVQKSARKTTQRMDKETRYT